MSVLSFPQLICLEYTQKLNLICLFPMERRLFKKKKKGNFEGQNKRKMVKISFLFFYFKICSLYLEMFHCNSCILLNLKLSPSKLTFIKID